MGDRSHFDALRELLLGRRNPTHFEIALLIASLVGLLILVGAVKDLFVARRDSKTPSEVSSSTRRASIAENADSIKSQDSDHTSRSDHSSAVARFRSKLMDFEYYEQLFSSIEPGATSGVIKIQVTNFWFEFKPHQKRQLTSMIANMWQQEAGTGNVIVHIYDHTGHEVAGTRTFGGVWIDDE